MELKENLDDYFASLEMRGSERYLLIEGPTDKEIFENFLNRRPSSDIGNSHDVKIDLVENIDLSDEPERPCGNREKVEYVAKKVLVDQQLRAKGIIFAGFADREFDDFDLNQIQDLRMDHRVDGYLVWSRGHSVENYLFEESLFYELLYDVLKISWKNQVVLRFRSVFIKTVMAACALGLAAHQLQRLTKIRDFINFNHLDLNENTVAIDFDALELSLSKKSSLDFDLAKLKDGYKSYYKQLLDIDQTVIKWLCDGHLGLSLLLFACCKCVEEKYPGNDRGSGKSSVQQFINSVLGLQPGKSKFYLCGNWWARKAETKHCEYPKELLKLLGLPNRTDSSLNMYF
ncbi:DUF4435 domain-containing protein [Leptothoe sp. ISB3NOV94-8A]